MPFCRWCKNSTTTYSKYYHSYIVGCNTKECNFVSKKGEKNDYKGISKESNEQSPVSDMVQYESPLLQTEP